jgi:hypothetical protein
MVAFKRRGAVWGEVMNDLTKNQQLAEDHARNLRCSGVNAHVVEVVAYEVVIDSHEKIMARLKRFQDGRSDAPVPMPFYERD